MQGAHVFHRLATQPNVSLLTTIKFCYLMKHHICLPEKCLFGNMRVLAIKLGSLFGH